MWLSGLVLAHTFANPYLGCKPKAKIATGSIRGFIWVLFFICNFFPQCHHNSHIVIILFKEKPFCNWFFRHIWLQYNFFIPWYFCIFLSCVLFLWIKIFKSKAQCQCCYVLEWTHTWSKFVHHVKTNNQERELWLYLEENFKSLGPQDSHEFNCV